MKKVVLYLILLMLASTINGQVGREFWFAAPDVWEGNGDAPVVLRVTTFDVGATITVSLPADNNRVLQQKTVLAGSHSAIQLNKSDVENSPANSINNKGILITSTADITAYYDVGSTSNPEKFTLKGDNALGREFFIPSQTIYGNASQYGGNANEKADIVATEDNTTITIIPACDITGHKAGVPYTITLNRGQTYSIECRDISIGAALAGTQINADKFIAVTISDDSVIEDVDSFPCDLIGDQLIPTNAIGYEYVAINTSKAPSSVKNSNTVQKVFVLAIEDNTMVFLNNTSKTVRELNKGETTVFDISDHAVFIYANKRVYAYQVTGLVNTTTTSANEMASAILPSYSCNGSNRVSFTRIFNRDFWVNLVVKRKHTKDFMMYDGSGSDVNFKNYIRSWQTVPGQDTGPEAWVCCAVNMNDLSTGLPYTIENKAGLFHLCVLDESDSRVDDGGTSFGYFSSYNSFWAMGPGQTCYGDQITLEAKDGMLNYQWFSKETGNQVLSTDRTLTVTESGKYWVEAEVQFGGCEVVDSLDVNFLLPEIELGNDTTVCEGEIINYIVGDGFADYLWSNGDKDYQTQFVADGTSSELSLTVTDNMGCTNSDTVNIQVSPVPSITLSATEVCEGSAIRNLTGFDRYEWVFNGVVINIDESQDWIIPEQSGVYTVTAWTSDGCSSTAQIDITVFSLPSFTLGDQFGCEGEAFSVDGPAGYVSYLWSTGEVTQSIVLNSDTDYWLEVTDNNGCTVREDGNVSFIQPIDIDLGQDRDECTGITLSIVNSTDYSDFNWTFEASSNPGTIIQLNPTPPNEYEISNSDVSNSGIYRLEALDINGCKVSDQVDITFHVTNPPVLSLTENLCEGQSVDVVASDGYDSYSWIIDGVARPEYDGMKVIPGVSTAGFYEVESTFGTCVKANHITVETHRLPQVNLPGIFSICDGGEKELSVDSYFSPDNAAFGYMYWNGNSNVRYSDWKTASLTVKTPGNYSVTAVDEFGCQASDNVNVSTVATSSLDLGDPQTACDYEKVTLTNPQNDAQSYSWYKLTASGESLLIDDAPLSVDESGTYILHIRDVNNCEVSDHVVVNFKSSPQISLGDDSGVCGKINLKITPDPSYNRYQWNDDPLLNTNELLVTQTGSYKLEVWNVDGCSAEDIVNITVSETPEVILGDFVVCAGEEVTLTGPSGAYSYLWNTGETSQTITASNGKYILKVTDANGCFTEAEASVVWRPVPKVDLGPDMIICPVDEWTIDAGDGFASYLWHDGSTTQSITASLMDTVNMVYVTDAFGCFGFDSQTVKHKVSPFLELISDTSVCSSDTLLLEVDSSFLMYEWSTGDTQAFVKLSEEGSYWLRAFDGCTWASDTMQLVLNPTPVIAHIDTSIYAQVALFPEGGTKPYLYALNDGYYQEENVFSDLSNGEHIFTVTDQNGCMAINSFVLNNILDIKIPPVLTPNEDGYNDTWDITGLEKVPDSIIRIFDRYGKLLVEYLATDPPWDGKYLGKPVPSDAYWYVIQLRPVNKTLKGHITIKR